MNKAAINHSCTNLFENFTLISPREYLETELLVHRADTCMRNYICFLSGCTISHSSQ